VKAEDSAQIEGFSTRSKVRLGMAMAGALMGIVLRLSHLEVPPLPALAAFGFSVLSAAFLLAWAAEALQVDISFTLPQPPHATQRMRNTPSRT
jgi:hypothetical protein